MVGATDQTLGRSLAEFFGQSKSAVSSQGKVPVKVFGSVSDCKGVDVTWSDNSILVLHEEHTKQMPETRGWERESPSATKPRTIEVKWMDSQHQQCQKIACLQHGPRMDQRKEVFDTTLNKRL